MPSHPTPENELLPAVPVEDTWWLDAAFKVEPTPEDKRRDRLIETWGRIMEQRPDGEWAERPLFDNLPVQRGGFIWKDEWLKMLDHVKSVPRVTKEYAAEFLGFSIQTVRALMRPRITKPRKRKRSPERPAQTIPPVLLKVGHGHQEQITTASLLAYVGILPDSPPK